MAERTIPLTLTSADDTFANVADVAGIIAKWQVPDQVEWLVSSMQTVYAKLLTAVPADISADSKLVLGFLRNNQQQLGTELAQLSYSAFQSLTFADQHNSQIAKLPKWKLPPVILRARQWVVVAVTSADVIVPANCDLEIPILERDV